jgi:hypothetical protein
MIERLLAIRANAIRNGDRNLAAEVQMELDRIGYVEPRVEAMEMAIPPKRGPGRPRKNVA